jgi:hypothetical protein
VTLIHESKRKLKLCKHILVPKMASDDEDKELDIPRDAKIIALILQSMGIQDCEP